MTKFYSTSSGCMTLIIVTLFQLTQPVAICMAQHDKVRYTRPTTAWQQTIRVPNQHPRDLSAAAGSQTVLYQSGSLSDFPLPGSPPPNPMRSSATNSLSDGPVLPAMPPSNMSAPAPASTSAVLPPSMPSSASSSSPITNNPVLPSPLPNSPTQLPSGTSSRSTVPTGAPPPSQQVLPSVTTPAHTPLQSASAPYTQPVSPQANSSYGSPNYNTGSSVSGSNVPVQTAPYTYSNPTPDNSLQAQPATYGQTAPYSGNSSLRSIQSGNASQSRSTTSGPSNAPQVTSGYPHVSAAPGNYLTSPINRSIFRNASYQTTAQVQPNRPGTLASNSQIVPTQANVPTASVYPNNTYPCAPGQTYPPPGAVPGTSVPPTVTANMAPNVYANNAGCKPLISLGQQNYNVQLGRGIIGQPVAYVPGQGVRNFFRYIFP